MNTYAPQLVSTFNQLQSILSSLTEEQLNKVPFAGSWTAGQVGDHLLKSYGVADTLKGRSAPANRPPGEKAKQIESIFLDFDTKLKAPDFIIPTNEHIHKEQLLQSLAEKIQDILHSVQTKDPTEVCLDFDLPGLGKLTRLEWASFVFSHTTRHIHQLKKIIASMAGAQ